MYNIYATDKLKAITQAYLDAYRSLIDTKRFLEGQPEETIKEEIKHIFSIEFKSFRKEIKAFRKCFNKHFNKIKKDYYTVQAKAIIDDNIKEFLESIKNYPQDFFKNIRKKNHLYFYELLPDKPNEKST